MGYGCCSSVLPVLYYRDQFSESNDIKLYVLSATLVE
eukprot:gene39853-49256_t